MSLRKYFRTSVKPFSLRSLETQRQRLRFFPSEKAKMYKKQNKTWNRCLDLMLDFNLDQLVMTYGATAHDSPRISQDDDFEQHFLPGCHSSSSSAAGRQTAFSPALAGNPDTLTAALISSTQVTARQTMRRRWRTMRASQRQKRHLNRERSLWKSLACKCVSSSPAWANQVWIPFIPVMCSLGCWANHEDHITLFFSPSTEH